MKLNYFIVLFILLIGFSSALQTFSVGKNAEIVHPVRVGDGLPSVNTNCNITIFYPNNTLFKNFQPMTNSGNYFNYTLNSTQTKLRGTYDYSVTCVSGALNKTDPFQFIINQGGIEPSQERTDALSRTIWIFFGLSLICFISVFFLKSFPVKLTLFIFMIWFMLIGINTSFVALQDEIVNPGLEAFFEFFVSISYFANYFIIISISLLWIITLLITYISNKRNKRIQRFEYGQ